MSRSKWAPRDAPTEYRLRAPLRDALLDEVAAIHARLANLGLLAEHVGQLETRKAEQPRERHSA